MSGEPNDEGLIDLFVFSHLSTAKAFEAIERLVEEGSIRFSARITGPYNLFTCHEVTDLNKAHDAVLELLGEEPPLIGFPREDGLQEIRGMTFAASSAICVEDGPKRVKRTPPCPLEALIRVTAAPGQDRRALLTAISVGPAYRGSCIVDGDYDILLELGAGSRATLKAARDAARSTPGVGKFMSSPFEPKAGPFAPDCAP